MNSPGRITCFRGRPRGTITLVWSPTRIGFRKTPGELAARVASYGEATDVFTSSTEIAATDSSYILGFSADLFRFPDEEQAAAWLREAPTRLGQEPDVTALATENGITGFDNEAIAVTLSRDFDHDGLEISHTSAVLFRSGTIVADIRLTRVNDPPSMSATKELAAAQAACLATTNCLIDDGLHLLIADDSPTNFGNHSCDANLWMADAVTLIVRRPIAAGEEVTVDYATHTADLTWSMTCNCGSPHCRRVVTNDDWRRPDVQERYAGHFSPFLNRRITAGGV